MGNRVGGVGVTVDMMSPENDSNSKGGSQFIGFVPLKLQDYYPNRRDCWQRVRKCVFVSVCEVHMVKHSVGLLLVTLPRLKLN